METTVFGGMHYPPREVHMIEWCRKHGETIDGRVIYQAKKQRATIDLCKRLGRIGRTGLAIDVGAHIGHWSIQLAREFAQVEAFEPVKAHRKCWVLNTEHLRHLKNMNLNALALGDRAGAVHMDVEAGNSGNSSVYAAGRPPADADFDAAVEMRTLDSFEWSGVDLIKIDTEGFEVQVLQGAADTVARCRPVIIVEQKRDMGAKYGNAPQQAVAMLRGWGYAVVADLGGDFLCAPADVKGLR